MRVRSHELERCSRVTLLAVFLLDTRDEFRVLEVSGPLAHSDSDAFRQALDQAAGMAAFRIADLTGETP